MSRKIEILSQVLYSFKDDENQIMNDINALLNNSDKEVDVVNKLKYKINKLSNVFSSISETQILMAQLTSLLNVKNDIDSSSDKNSEQN